MLGGNHDHGLVARLDRRPPAGGAVGVPRAGGADRPGRGRAAGRPPGRARAAGPLLARLPGRLAARRRLRHPRALLRPPHHRADVRAARRRRDGALGRCRLPEDGARPDDYEAALAPLYAFMHQLTQRSDHAAISAGAGASARAWVALAGEGRRRHPVRAAALGPAYVGAVAAINRGRARPGRPPPLGRRRCGAAACAGWARCCGASACARRGCCGATPTAPARGPATTRRSGARPEGSRLLNTGSWVYQPHFLAGGPDGLALLAGQRRGRGGGGPAAAHPPAGGSLARGAATPGVKHVAWQVTPGPTSRSSTPAVWCGCSTSG